MLSSSPTSLVAGEATAGRPPIYEANVHVCSDHFVKMCYVLSALMEFGPSRRTLKVDTVLTIFAFNSLPKRRRLSKARLARAEHKAVLNYWARNKLTVPRLDFSSWLLHDTLAYNVVRSHKCTT